MRLFVGAMPRTKIHVDFRGKNGVCGVVDLKAEAPPERKQGRTYGDLAPKPTMSLSNRQRTPNSIFLIPPQPPPTPTPSPPPLALSFRCPLSPGGPTSRGPAPAAPGLGQPKAPASEEPRFWGVRSRSSRPRFADKRGALRKRCKVVLANMQEKMQGQSRNSPWPQGAPRALRSLFKGNRCFSPSMSAGPKILSGRP